MFAHLFHIRPWEWDLLTVAETDLLKAESDAWLKATKEASRGA